MHEEVAPAQVRADNDERTRRYYSGEVTRDSAGVERGPDGIMIETMGFADNLMLHGGVLNRGGVVMVGDAPKGAEMTDMTAFKRILTIAGEKLR